MTRFRAVLVALATMFAVFAGAGVAAAPAQASDVGVLGCQSSRLYVYPVSGPPSSYNCSGTYNLSVNASRIVTNGWSGWVIADNVQILYCDWQTLNFSPYAHVTKLWLSPERTSWC